MRQSACMADGSAPSHCLSFAPAGPWPTLGLEALEGRGEPPGTQHDSLVILVGAILDVPTHRLHVLPETGRGVTRHEQHQSEQP